MDRGTNAGVEAAPTEGTSESAVVRPISVLLWSLAGAGLQYGGPGMTAYRMYRLASEDRLRITLAHGVANQQDNAPFVATHRVSPFKAGSAISQIRFLLSAKRWLTEHASEFDVFHGLQGFDVTVRPALVSERCGVPAVVKLAQHNHDLADKPGLRSLLGLAARRREAIARLSGIIAISQAIHDELLEIGIPESKIARISNGVDTDHFVPPGTESERAQVRSELGWPDRKTIVFSGAVIRRKRPHLLVHALAHAVKSEIDAQLALVGPEMDAEYASEIRGLAGELKVDDRLIWTGFVGTVAPYLQAADVFALLSAKEGMPNALLEAMASGLPSVVTAISGTTDLIEDGLHGRLVEPTTEMVSPAILGYLADDSLKSAAGSAARRRVEAQFSARAVLAAHERLFKRLMHGQPAAE